MNVISCVFTVIGDNSEDGIIKVCVKTFGNGRSGARHMIACICHRKLLVKVCEFEGARTGLNPREEVDDLLAVEVDYAEVFASFNLESVAVTGGNDGAFEITDRFAC